MFVNFITGALKVNFWQLLEQDYLQATNQQCQSSQHYYQYTENIYETDTVLKLSQRPGYNVKTTRIHTQQVHSLIRLFRSLL